MVIVRSVFCLSHGICFDVCLSSHILACRDNVIVAGVFRTSFRTGFSIPISFIDLCLETKIVTNWIEIGFSFDSSISLRDVRCGVEHSGLYGDLLLVCRSQSIFLSFSHLVFS